MKWVRMLENTFYTGKGVFGADLKVLTKNKLYPVIRTTQSGSPIVISDTRSEFLLHASRYEEIVNEEQGQ